MTPLWILVVLMFSLTVSHFNQIRLKNLRLKVLGNNLKFSKKSYNLGINDEVFAEWINGLNERQKELEKKEKGYRRLKFEDQWIGSRVWGAWKNHIDNNEMRKGILMSMIYFGTNLKTPIEFALEEAENWLRSYPFLDREREIKFWCQEANEEDKKSFTYDAEYIKKYYSEEDAKYIFHKIYDYWDLTAENKEKSSKIKT